MTWNGLCPACRDSYFMLTVNNEGLVYVNCRTCYELIGHIPVAEILSPPMAEEH
jgi:uncharacterized protein YbaR (Trm112 family)